jgi:hypothetical protein
MDSGRKPEEPIEGQSHWCDGYITTERRDGRAELQIRSCFNVVRNDNDHCEAGHMNKIRLSGVMSTDVIRELNADPTSYEVGDLAVTARRSSLSELSGEELTQEIIAANEELGRASSMSKSFFYDDTRAWIAQRRLFDAAMRLSKLQSKSAAEVELRTSRVLHPLREYFEHAHKPKERIATISDESFVEALLEELSTELFWRKVTIDEMDKIFSRAEDIEHA